MLRNFNVPIMTLDGTPFKDADKEVMLKAVCVNCLYSMDRDGAQPKPLSGEEHLKRHILAKKIYASEGPIDVTAEEISWLKELVAKNYMSSLVGPVFELLEGNA